MAQHQSAKKRIRQDEKKRLRNRYYKKSARTAIAKLREMEEKFPDDDNIPRPPHWSGFRIKPDSVEFWQDGEFRLHDRIVFSPNSDGWDKVRLYP